MDTLGESAHPLDLSLRIAHKDFIAADICLFRLESTDGSLLPSFEAGAHINVRTPHGLIRKYSLCGDPHDLASYRIAVQKEKDSAGGSVSLIQDTDVGDVLSLSKPENAFSFEQKAPRYIFIAGGIGITPIYSMIAWLEAEGIQGWKLYYLTKDPSVTAFLAQLRTEDMVSRVHIHHSQEASGKRFDLWPILEKANSAHVYCCGPRELMEDVRAMTGHWSPSRVHFESFVTGGRPQPDDKAFRVRIRSTGDEFVVPVGQSILTVLRENGYPVPSSCESGTCGTCRTRIRSGVADHRDMVLMPEEQEGQIMLCVSRAESPMLELDL